jgi:hypothetical protein
MRRRLLDVGQLSHRLDILLAGQEGFQHPASTGAHHVAGDCGQLAVGALEHFVQPVHLLRPLLDQGLAVAGELAQCADGPRRDEAGLEQSVAQQIGQPLTVLHIGLMPGRRLHVLGIDQGDSAPLFQQVIHWPPVHPRTLDRHLLDLFVVEPGSHLAQLPGHGRERPRRLARLAIRLRPQDGHDDRLLVDVDARTALVENLHVPTSSEKNQPATTRGR